MASERWSSAAASAPSRARPLRGAGEPASLLRVRSPLLARLGGERNWGDFSYRRLTALAASVLLVLLVAMAVELARRALPALREFGLGFVVGTSWNPVSHVYGALPFIYGTVASSLLALALALPVSLGIALSLSELAPGWLRGPLGFLVELLAAVPSVVYGLWGMFVLVPWLRDSVQPWLHAAFGFLPIFGGGEHGFGLLAGAVVLAIMITPTIAAVSREVLRAVPSSLREAALALGATRWEAVRVAVLPYARSGLAGAALLGFGRALGETMAITMVIGNRAEISASLFAPAYTMASVIANEFSEASDTLHLAALAEIGLLLFLVTVVLNLLARVLIWRVGAAATRGRL